MAWMGKQKRKGRGDEMCSNYTQLLAWLPATASFTVQVQVCVSVCAIESVWSAFVQVLSKYSVVVTLMRTQIRAVSVSVGVNVRTSVLTERYREGVSPESPGAWMAAFTKEQRSLTFRDKSPEMFSAKGQTTTRFFPPSPASAGAVKRALHGAAFLLHKSARWRLRYNLRGRWGVRPLHTSGSQTQELRWSDGVWMCRAWTTFCS